MAELFLVGTFWFWAIIIAELVLLFIFVSNENGVGAFVSLIAFACCLQFLGDADILNLVMSNPIWTAVIAAGYIALSIPWGVFRWSMFCRDQLEKYEDLKVEFLRKKGVTNVKIVPAEYRAEWKSYVESTKDYSTKRTIAEAPLARENKAFITRSMSLWMIDVVLFVFGDMCVRIWKHIYNRIAGMLQHISDSMFFKSNIHEDMAAPDDTDE